MRYEAQCLNCEAGYDYYAPVSRCYDVPACPLCSGQGRKVIFTAPNGVVKGKFEPFKSMVDGSLIASQRDLEEHNKRNNVRLLNDGYDEQTIRAGAIPVQKVEVDKKEIAADLHQAVKAVEAGYKPQVQTNE